MIPAHPILVLRHGETEWNVAGRWQGALDSPLTARGLAQARAMGAMLARRGIGPRTHRLLTSPQGRARATADLAAAATGLVPEPDARLREIGVGVWAGLSRAEADARWPPKVPDAHFLDRYARAPGGEPFETLWARVSDLLAALDGPTVLVTHGITSRFLRTAATGGTLDGVRDVPGGQGVVFHVACGRSETWTPPLADAPGAG